MRDCSYVRLEGPLQEQVGGTGAERESACVQRTLTRTIAVVVSPRSEAGGAYFIL